MTVYLHAVGCLSPQGSGLIPTREAFAADRPCPYARGPEEPARPSLPDAGWVAELRRPNTALVGRFARMDRLCQLALGPALEAAAAAPPTIVPPARRGLVFGTAMGSHSVNERYYRGLLAEGAAGASPALFAYTLPSTPAAELSIQLGLEGPLVTLALGTGAGLQALGEAAVLLEGGAADWMLAGGAEALGETLLRAWLGVETPLAEGAAFAVLSRVADGAWARVAGHARAFGPDAGERAVSAVLARAGLRAAELGTRIDPGSACDRQSLRVFGESLAARPLLALSCCLESVACLPLLVVAEDPSGLVDALCLTAP